MSSLSAVFAGQVGFQRSVERMSEAAEEIAQRSSSEGPPPEALVKMEVEANNARANLRTVSVSLDLEREFLREIFRRR